MRIPLPVFYVAEDRLGRLIVVDGRQRLTTLKRFMDGDLSLKLEDRRELDGKRFVDLEVRLQNRLEDAQLLFYIIDSKVPERARLDIFERVNGGEVLTRQQMRNAIYNGKATEFLKREAATDLFVQATGNSLDTGKMRDREFVNRFCAFRLLEHKAYRDMDDWLAQALEKLNQLTDDDLREMSNKFRTALKNNYIVFGPHAFRKHWRGGDRRSIINAALYDVMMYYLADKDEGNVTIRMSRLRDSFYNLMQDQAFIKAITNGPNTPKEVWTRFKIGGRVMREVFDAA
jgi:hypothetical protein